ncbi:hypothetical protein [Streptomyces clavuligerus]|uniref:Uncharacterized protein n=1 Tax=Streptomyces clavuligerus TaxID=1901 RepID=B5GVA8_STRCL|nr:hypothetical protein [Streptomyces clavuligerus]ANW20168.1 hypothetical protein BB341_19090 [Streptomyces clavuligerus]AXU14795.1 hypothetical protein D1794_19910 [Streptomyces clavuligerus]EDY50254.1 conserved hypothetical protein [Streptomyces clavuligerus]EFG06921.1 Hypothetical protein SCLAV_1846 [Streptomyces clavuligerus]MBY6304825.1 hypothetical protein [Streptomyces clavuligerus]
MSVPVQRLSCADAREAEDLSAFLARLLRYDRAAAVRLQAGGPDGALPQLAVFGRPPSFEVLAIRAARLAEPARLDVTVSAGELLEAIQGADFTVPGPVTGPPWAGVLPPRGGWRDLAGLPGADRMREAVAAAVAEFRARDEALPEERRTRAERDRVGREIWSRTLGDTPLPLRAVHAAQSLGFLRPGVPAALLASGSWLRLRTPFGSVALRTGGLGPLSVTPTRPPHQH